jgi:hypothetical protein
MASSTWSAEPASARQTGVIRANTPWLVATGPDRPGARETSQQRAEFVAQIWVDATVRVVRKMIPMGHAREWLRAIA